MFQENMWVNGRQVKGCIFVIIANEYRKEEDLPDIHVRIAPAKILFQQGSASGTGTDATGIPAEMCEKQPYFLSI